MLVSVLFLATHGLGCGVHEALDPDGNCIPCNTQFPDCYTCTFYRDSNLLSNGDFEVPNIEPDTWRVVSAIEDWSIAGNSGEIVRATPAYHGDQYLEMDSHGNYDIFQTVETLYGQNYQLSYAYAPRNNQPPSTNEVKVFINNIEVATHAHDGSSGQVWSTFSHTFTAETQTTIQFSGSGTSDGLGGRIDDVQLKILDNRLLYLVEYCFEPSTTCILCHSAAPKQQCSTSSTVEECMDCYAGIENGALKPAFCVSDTGP